MRRKKCIDFNGSRGKAREFAEDLERGTSAYGNYGDIEVEGDMVCIEYDDDKEDYVLDRIANAMRNKAFELRPFTHLFDEFDGGSKFRAKDIIKRYIDDSV